MIWVRMLSSSSFCNRQFRKAHVGDLDVVQVMQVSCCNLATSLSPSSGI